MRKAWPIVTVLSSILLTGCPIIEIVQPFAKITTSKTTIHVGEMVDLDVEYDYGASRNDPTAMPRGPIYAFLYSTRTGPNNGPYRDDARGNILPDSVPELFPVDSKVSIINPNTGSGNVPMPILASYESGKLKARFTIQAKEAGTVVIRAGLVSQDPPGFWSRMFTIDYDTKVNIAIAP